MGKLSVIGFRFQITVFIEHLHRVHATTTRNMCLPLTAPEIYLYDKR